MRLNATPSAYPKKPQPEEISMELIAAQIEASTTDLAIDSSVDQLIELAANDLALVGGGTANVCWL
jgi:hypothetical protein